jgi:hypothetical protein
MNNNIGSDILGVVTIIYGIVILILRYKRVGFLDSHYKTRNLEGAVGKKGADSVFLLISILAIIMGLIFIFHEL